MTRDFREKFHVSINEVGLSVRYDEAQSLIVTLSQDPSSWFHAAKNKWKHPLTREGMVLLDLATMVLAKWSKRGSSPYPSPYPSKGTQTLGAAQQRTKSEVQAILRPDPS